MPLWLPALAVEDLTVRCDRYELKERLLVIISVAEVVRLDLQERSLATRAFDSRQVEPRFAELVTQRAYRA